MGQANSVNCFDQYALRSGAAAKSGLVLAGLTKTMRDDLDKYFGAVAVPFEYKQEVQGGGDNAVGGSILGGADVLQDYGNSRYSQAKEKLIRGIAEEVFSILGLKGARYAQSAPIGDVVTHLAKVVPDPKKGKSFTKDFNKSSSKQMQTLNALVRALNKNYGGTLIDAEATPAVKVRAVSEVMHTLFQGLHTEFMSVAGDVLRVLRNMQTLNDFVEASYKKQKELVDKSGDTGLKEQSDQVKIFYDQLKEELNRQMAMVSNMLNVSVGKTGKDLIMLLEDNNQFSSAVTDLKANLGTGEFGNRLAHLLTGVSSVAHAAAMIEKSLKDLGMSAKEFKNAKNESDLRLRIYDHIQKKSPSSRELDKMMAAANVIYKHDYNHGAIAKAMKGGYEKNKVNSGEEEEDELVFNNGDSEDEVNGGGVIGGYDSDEDDGLPTYWSKKSLSKKIKNKEKYRKQLLKDFNKLLKAHYRTIINASTEILEAMGKSVPINDDLERFITVFGNMPSMNEDNLHVALSGYAKDAVSNSRREKFMNNYNLVELAIEPLAKGAGGGAFKRMQMAIRDIVKAINNFSDKIVDSLTEIHVDRPEVISAAVRGSMRDFFGGDDADFRGDNSYVEFERVKMAMSYKYSIANIKTNLSRAAEEMKVFGTDYEEVLGEEAGWHINKIKKEYEELIKNTNPDSAYVGGGAYNANVSYEWKRYVQSVSEQLIAMNAVGLAGVAGGVGVGDEGSKCHKGLCTLWERQRDAKVKMVEVAQAVDLYLRSFADGVARNPDSIKSIVKMLDQVDLVAKWFNNRSGDNLAGLFEEFPNSMNGAVPSYSSAERTLETNGKLNSLPEKSVLGEHYYAWVEENVGGNPDKLPGNPTLGQGIDTKHPKDYVKGLLNLGSKTVKSMRALENILSAFSSVGSKFGDLDPQNSTFMNPGQIFNALCEYITCSAFTTGFAPQTDNITAALHIGAVEAKDTTDNMGNTPINIPSTNAGQDRYRGGRGGDWDRPELDFAMSLSKSRSGNVVRSARLDGFGILSGVSNEHDNANAMLRKFTTIAMASLPDTSGSTAISSDQWTYHDAENDTLHVDSAGWNDRMYDTDNLFIMTIKSIVCKVFTVVDAYRLFNRPTINRESHDSLNPIRTILGGADGGGHVQSVPVIAEATELYMRLPLLAEWYREMFGMTQDRPPDGGNAGGWVLSIVPAIDGTWSDLVRIIFDKASYVTSGNYSETQVQKLIEAINKVYKSYKNKYPRSTNRNIMNSFVLEMNRVFGFLKQTEIEEYFKNKRNYLDDKQSTEDPLFNKDYLDYDILNAEDQFGRNPAPSDRFVNVITRNNTRKKRNMEQLQKSIMNLRTKIDVDFHNFSKKTKDNTNTTAGFRDTIKSYKIDLDSASSAIDKYNVVLGMMQGSTKIINASADKIIMLHEAVAAPLMAICNIYRVLDKFNSLIHGTAFENIISWNRGRLGHWRVPAADNEGGIINAPDGAVELGGSYGFHLKNNVYKNAHPADIEKLVTVLLGDTVSRTENKTGATVYGLNIPAGGNVHAALAEAQEFDMTRIQWDKILRDQLSAILDLSANSHKLVTINVGTTGAVNVDFTHLEEVTMDLLENVKSNINKMRLGFAKEKHLLDRYENTENFGSTRWLDEHMVQKLFKNRDGLGMDVGVSVALRGTLLRAGKPGVIKAFAIPGAAGLPANIGNVTGWEDCGVGRSMENAVNSLVYWGSNAVAGAGDKLNIAQSYTHNNFKTFPFNVLPMLKNSADLTPRQRVAIAEAMADKKVADIADINSVTPVPIIAFTGVTGASEETTPDIMNSWKLNSTLNSSLFLRFNQLVHRYLHDNMDSGTQKFYMPLVESFMNGAASVEVIQNRAFPNVYPRGHQDYANAANQAFITGTNDERMAAPPVNIVLFNSSVQIMKAFANTMDPLLKKKRHSYESVAEIPEYMKERMRTNLPYYSKLFGQVYERSNLLRALLSNTSLKNNIAAGNGAAIIGAGGTGVAANARGTIDNGGVRSISPDSVPMINLLGFDSSRMTEYLIGLLNRLTQLSQSIKQCTDSTYKELHDVNPFFMDVRKDFSKDYRQLNGTAPLMPASNLLLPQNSLAGNRNEWDTKQTLLLPTGANGSDSYKFNYASRLVLARNDVEPQMNQMPGAVNIYDSYARSSSRESTISANEYKNTILTMTTLARFLNDGSSHGRLYAMDRIAENVRSRLAIQPASSSVWLGTEPLYDVVGALQSIVLGGRMVNSDAMIKTIIGTRINDEYTYDNIIVAYHAGAAAEKIKLRSLIEKRIRNAVPYIFQSKGAPDNRMLNVLNLAENPNAAKNKEDFASVIDVISSDRSGVRADMRTANILDLNIVPINVHAFMREVAFTNILNYSYTFDRMIHEFVLPSYLKSVAVTTENLTIKPNNIVNSTREVMVKLLCHPYANLGASGNVGKEYYALVGSLFNGNDNLKLGRPRYLSDQLWHKVLLTSSAQLVAGQKAFNQGAYYDNNLDALEAGPQAYEAQRAVVRYGAPGYDQTDSVHTRMGNDDQSIKITDYVRNAARRAIVALDMAITNATYNEPFDYLRSGTAIVDAGTIDSLDYMLKNSAGVEAIVTPIHTLLSNSQQAMYANPYSDHANAALSYGYYDAVYGAPGVRGGALLLTEFGKNNAGAVNRDAAINASNALTLGGDGVAAIVLVGLDGDPNTFLTVARTIGNYDVNEFKLMDVLPGVLLANGSVSRFSIMFKDIINTEIPDDNGIGGLVRQLLLFTVMVITLGNNSAANLVALDTVLNQASLLGASNLVVAGTGQAGALAFGFNRDDLAARQMRLVVLIFRSFIAGGNRTAMINNLLQFLSLYKSGLLEMLLNYLSDQRRPAGLAAATMTSLLIPSDPVATTGLKFWGKAGDKNTWRVANQNAANMSAQSTIYCAELGLVRFNTKLVRNLTWLVQLQRIMRVVMTDHLDWIDSPVIKGLKITNPVTTEYNANDQFTQDDFNGVRHQMF
jgi:hypothetical protein